MVDKILMFLLLLILTISLSYLSCEHFGGTKEAQVWRKALLYQDPDAIERRVASGEDEFEDFQQLVAIFRQQAPVESEKLKIHSEEIRRILEKKEETATEPEEKEEPKAFTDAPAMFRYAEKNCLSSGWLENSYFSKNVSKIFLNYCKLSFSERFRQLKKLSLRAGKDLHKIFFQKEAILQYRKTGLRDRLLDEYHRLYTLWQDFATADIPANAFGLTRHEYLNDILWNARYQALHQNHDLAQQITEDVIAYAMGKEQYAEALYEAVHILSFRIFADQGNFQAAYSAVHDVLGKEVEDKEWKERLHWFAGFYAFLVEDYPTSIAVWSQIVEEFPDSKYYFWLAVAHSRQGEFDLAHKYGRELIEKHPISFYATYLEKVLPETSQKASLMPAVHGQYTAYELQGLPDFLSDQDLKAVRTNNQWLYLLSISWDLPKEWQEFYARKVEKELTPEHELRYLYLVAKIYFYKKDYLNSVIRLVRVIRKDPSFVYAKYFADLYYPLVYSEDFYRASGGGERGAVDAKKMALLYSLAKQESAFTPHARSGANAYGLLQLLPSTAKRLAKKNNDSIETQDLLDPQTNIELASLYVDELFERTSGVKTRAIASYNAGFAAVSQWERRLPLKIEPTLQELVWIELIPYGQTRYYVMNILRNFDFYFRAIQSKVEKSKIGFVDYFKEKRSGRDPS